MGEKVSLPKLPVKDVYDIANDLFKKSEQPQDIHTVDVPDVPELVPIITWPELLAAYINTRMRNYVTDTVTGQIVTVSTRFWLGVVCTVVVETILVFLLWKIGLF